MMISNVNRICSHTYLLRASVISPVHAARIHDSTGQRLPNRTVAAAQPDRHQEFYDDAYRRSIKRPEDFWAAAAEQLTWHKKWDKVLDDSNSPFTKWFINVTYIYVCVCVCVCMCVYVCHIHCMCVSSI